MIKNILKVSAIVLVLALVSSRESHRNESEGLLLGFALLGSVLGETAKIQKEKNSIEKYKASNHTHAHAKWERKVGKEGKFTKHG